MAAMAAIEPVLEVLLKIGITSPEAESLMRGLFVHRARDSLASQAGGVAPTDVRLALVTGVHRNFVRRILSEPPVISSEREGRAYLPGRVLRGWQTDPLYRDEGGKPRDIPEEGPAPSFAALTAEYLSGRSASTVLQELIRSGAVQSLEAHRVRLRSRAARRPGLNLESVTVYGLQARALLATLTARLCDPQAAAFLEVTPVFGIAADRMPLIRDVVARRAGTFLTGLEHELSRESKGSRGRKVRFSLSVVELAGPVRARRRKGEGSS